MKRVEMTTFEFKRYLDSKTVNWGYQHFEKQDNAAFNEYYDLDGEIIALQIFDNHTCDSWIYIP